MQKNDSTDAIQNWKLHVFSAGSSKTLIAWERGESDEVVWVEGKTVAAGPSEQEKVI